MNDEFHIFHNPDVTEYKEIKMYGERKHGVRKVWPCEIMQAEIDFLFESR